MGVEITNNSFQIVFVYTDPFLMQFSELELYLWNMLLNNEVGPNYKVYINIFQEPTVNLYNVSFNRSDVVHYMTDSSLLSEYSIDLVCNLNQVAPSDQYVDILSNFSGNIYAFDVIVPVEHHNDIIGQIVVLKHPSSSKQIISICGIDNLKNELESLE